MEHDARYIDTIAKFSNFYICLLLKIKALENWTFGKTFNVQNHLEHL
jgi:hypothetical protein